MNPTTKIHIAGHCGLAGTSQRGARHHYPFPLVRGCCRFSGFSVNSTRSLLRSGLPAFGTTTAYPLRVPEGESEARGQLGWGLAQSDMLGWFIADHSKAQAR